MTFTFAKPLSLALAPFAMGLALASACSDGASDAAGGGGSGSIGSGILPKDKPIDGLTEEQTKAFNQGDYLFDLNLRTGDGLGPLYTRNNCGACHTSALRGPGTVTKMSVVEADNITPAADQSKLAFGHTVHPLLAAGATKPILPPPDDPTVRVTFRMGPPVLGRGYMEAIEDSEIERIESEQAGRSDGIHGRINHVVYASEANPDTSFHQHQKGDTVIGRFGVKARIATLDDFAADALQGDMGITSPLRPEEFANPDGLLDDLKPGVDVTAESVNFRANYTRMLSIPRAKKLSDEAQKGKAIFEAASCSVCHAPSLHTRSDYPIGALADLDAAVYTDFLLHDMGDDLADGLEGVDGEAGPRDWRTSPLIGMSFFKSFLHDGRAKSIEDAIVAHGSTGSEAAGAVAAFQALSPDDAAALIAFVTSL